MQAPEKSDKKSDFTNQVLRDNIITIINNK